jgi:hypothetical protein
MNGMFDCVVASGKQMLFVGAGKRGGGQSEKRREIEEEAEWGTTGQG